MKELTKLDQHALELVVDAVTAAVAEVLRDRLDELHAKIAHVQLEVAQVVKRGLAPERPSATTLPFGKAQNALPRKQLTEVPQVGRVLSTNAAAAPGPSQLVRVS